MPRPSLTSRRRFLLGGVAGLAGLSAGPLRAEEPAWVPTADWTLKQVARDAPLSLTFRGTTAAECRAWQAEFAAKVRSLLGPHTPPAKWATAVEKRVERDDHRRDELV